MLTACHLLVGLRSHPIAVTPTLIYFSLQPQHLPAPHRQVSKTACENPTMERRTQNNGSNRDLSSPGLLIARGETSQPIGFVSSNSQLPNWVRSVKLHTHAPRPYPDTPNRGKTL